MKISVRHAQVGDLDWIMGEFPEFSSHYGTKTQIFEDNDYSRATSKNIVENHLALLAECSERGPVGFIFGLVTNHLYNQNIKVLTELFWWVPPRFRNGRAAALLFNEFTAWGKKNCDLVTFGVMESTPVKHTAITKRGFKLVERSYLLEVATCL